MPTRLRALSLPPLPKAAAAPSPAPFGGSSIEALEEELEALLAAEPAPDGSILLPWDEDTSSLAGPAGSGPDPFRNALAVRAEMLREQLQRGGCGPGPQLIGAVRQELAAIEALLEELGT
ncbi:MAG: hypothetical protein ACOVNL_09720 [Prochlorococcaceae cyanobacterium]|jgi:hypothetical protein